MNTRSKSRIIHDGDKKFALVAFSDTLSSSIHNIENIEKPKKKLPGSTIRLEVEGKWQRGTIVSTSENFDSLLVGLRGLNVAAFFGISKRNVSSERKSKNNKRIRENTLERVASNRKKQKVDVETESPKKSLNRRSRIPIPLSRRKQPYVLIPSEDVPKPSEDCYDDLPQFSPISACLSPIYSIPPSSPDPEDIKYPVQSPTPQVQSPTPQVSLSPISKLDKDTPTVLESDLADKTPTVVESDLSEKMTTVLESDLSYSSKLHNRTFILDTASSALKKNLDQRLEEIRPKNYSPSYSEYISLESPHKDLSLCFAEEGSPEKALDLSPLKQPNLSDTYLLRNLQDVQIPIFGFGNLQESIPSPPVPKRDFKMLSFQPYTESYLPYSSNSQTSIVYPIVHPTDQMFSSKGSYSQATFYPINRSMDTSPTQLYPTATSTPAFQGPPCMYQANSYEDISPVHQTSEPRHEHWNKDQNFLQQSSTPIFNNIPQRPMTNEASIIHPVRPHKQPKGHTTTTPTNLVAIFQEQLAKSEKMDNEKNYEIYQGSSNGCNEMDVQSSAVNQMNVKSSVINEMDVQSSVRNEMDVQSSVRNEMNLQPSSNNRMSVQPSVRNVQPLVIKDLYAQSTAINDINVQASTLNAMNIPSSVINEMNVQSSVINEMNVQSSAINEMNVQSSAINAMNAESSVINRPVVMSTITHPKLLKLRPVQFHVKGLKPEYLQQCMDQLPEDSSQFSLYDLHSQMVMEALNSSKNKPEVFARELMGRMFTLEEVRDRNVYGIRRKNRLIGALDPARVSFIKNTVETYFPGSFFGWKFCVLKMNEYIGSTFKKLRRFKWLNID